MLARQSLPVTEVASAASASASVHPWYDPSGWFAEEEPAQVAKPFLGDLAKRMLEGLPPELREEMAAEERVQADLDAQPDRDPNRDGYRRSAARIGRGYADEAPVYDGRRAAPLGTREERLAALDRFTQNADLAGGEEEGADRCGATTLLAGAMLGGGTGGVKLLLDTAAASDGVDKSTKLLLDQVAKKLARGEALTDGDLHFVQEGLHQHLRSVDVQTGRAVEGRTGVDGRTLAELVDGNEELRKMFVDGGLGVAKIDNDGDDVANHFVLQIGQPGADDEAVYDPLARKDGHQVVTDPTRVNDYELARHQLYRPT
jgi:hypothetical protein